MQRLADVSGTGQNNRITPLCARMTRFFQAWLLPWRTGSACPPSPPRVWSGGGGVGLCREKGAVFLKPVLGHIGRDFSWNKNDCLSSGHHSRPIPLPQEIFTLKVKVPARQKPMSTF